MVVLSRFLRSIVGLALAIGLGSILVGAPSLAGESCKTPLPDGFKLAPPPAGLPDDLKRFHGVWGNGKWDGQLCHTLVLEVLDAKGSVNAVYSWGDSEGWNVKRGYSIHRGSISGDVVDLPRFSNGAKVDYTLAGDKLSGRYVRKGNETKITVTPIKDIPQMAATPTGAGQDLVGTWEGEYDLANGNGGDTTIKISSVSGRSAKYSMEWRWPVQKSASHRGTANVLMDDSGEVLGIELWPNSGALKLQGDRLAGTINLRVGPAEHRFTKE